MITNQSISHVAPSLFINAYWWLSRGVWKFIGNCIHKRQINLIVLFSFSFSIANLLGSLKSLRINRQRRHKRQPWDNLEWIRPGWSCTEWGKESMILRWGNFINRFDLLSGASILVSSLCIIIPPCHRWSANDCWPVRDTFLDCRPRMPVPWGWIRTIQWWAILERLRIYDLRLTHLSWLS